MKFDKNNSTMQTMGLILVGMGFLQSAHAFFRMPCSQPVVVERSDPIVNPGSVSGHLHTIMGSAGFNFTQDFAAARAGKCTSCKAKQDLSNYWIPQLFYQAQNGSFHRVEQIGGALIYYLQRTDPAKPNEQVAPFPPGFRMLAGDPFVRSYDPNSLAQKAISYACLDYNGPPTAETHNIPNRNCPSGLRSQVFFPSCWNGQLDSPDHKSHMAYPSGMDSGSCPSTHPTRLVSIFYEVIWDTNPWKDQWWKQGTHPFVFASGDPTGYGLHGDFLNGWDQTALERALKKCTQLSGVIEDCAADLELLTNDQMKDCVNPSKLDEVTTGWLPSLPGCNAVTNGPERATPQKDGTCGKNVPSILSNDQVGFMKKTVPFWDPVGCAQDSLNNRLLPKKFTDPAMTIEKCGTTCHNNGFNYAGLQWGVECWCGSTFDESKANLYGSCTQPCAGDASETCGNGQILSVYKYNPNKTTGGSSSASSSPASTTIASTSASSSGPASSSSSSVPISSSSSSQAPSSSPSTTHSLPAATSSTTSPAATVGPAPPSSTNVPSGWNYRGCYVDTVRPRTLNGSGIYYDVPMTPKACTDHCARKGFAISGTEYTGECFCGNKMNGGAKLRPESECNMPCRGDSNIMCGGPGRLSVYTRDTRRLKRDETDVLEARGDVELVQKRNNALSHHRRSLHGRSRL